jgi:hypothetical protein
MHTHQPYQIIYFGLCTSLISRALGLISDCKCIAHRLSINRPTKRGKEKSPSDGHCQCEKVWRVNHWRDHF